MRFKLKPKPKNNDTRTITKFLFFPVNINGEVRWLEKCTISQRYIIRCMHDDPNMVYKFWSNEYFVD